MKKESDYALYKGDSFITLGTVKQIASYMGVRPDTIRYYGTNTYRKNFSDKKDSNAMVLIKIEKD